MNTSVIIPTLNDEKYIGKVLQSLAKQTIAPFEIIVVNGYSSDRTEDIVKNYSNVKFYKTPPHISYQINYGARLAKGDIYIFLDADTVLPPQFI